MGPARDSWQRLRDMGNVTGTASGHQRVFCLLVLRDRVLLGSLG